VYNLDQLRGFVAVAEEGNVGRAAERLHLTQPPLSRQIQKLERAIGVELFERTSRGVELTTGGRVFLDDARRILALVESASLRARGVAEGSAGVVRVGFTALTASSVLGRWIRLATKHLPDVELVLREMVTRDQISALHSGQLDIGIARGVRPDQWLATRQVHAESLMLAVPRDHRLGRSDGPVGIADLVDVGLVGYSPTRAAYLHEAVLAVFLQHGFTPRLVQQVGQVNSVISLVDAGVGPALVPESAAAFHRPGVVHRMIEHMPTDLVRAQAVWRVDGLNPAADAFRELVLSNLTERGHEAT